MDKYIERLDKILSENNVCQSHNTEHCVSTMSNAKKALEVSGFNLSEKEEECILLAALLHDADDRKFFPNNKNFENLKSVLIDYDEKYLPLIIKMVDLVSSSKNGDNVPEDIKDKEWMLYPRYADRLEALGLIGIYRCFKYGLTTGNPLYVETTARPMNEEEIWLVASEERYKRYNGKSNSMIDHYYDKLLRASMFPIRNKFFDEQSIIRRKAQIDFILYFSNKKTINNDDILNFISNYT